MTFLITNTDLLTDLLSYFLACLLTYEPTGYLGDGALLAVRQPHLGPNVTTHEVVVEVVRVGLQYGPG